MKLRAIPVVFLLLIASCREQEAALPPPVPITGDTTGYFCRMNLSEHDGPKGQIHLADTPAPIFFAQVRDALAYHHGEERSADIVAVYVSDMGAALSWEAPGVDNWILADQAIFVVGADVTGGMGAPEIVPFKELEAASSFVARHGGIIAALNDIPGPALFGPVIFKMDGDPDR